MTFGDLILFLAFFLSIAGLVATAATYVHVQNLRDDWLERIGDLEDVEAQLRGKQDELKLALEIVHKLHTERQDDIKPLRDEIAVLTTKINVVGANVRRPI